MRRDPFTYSSEERRLAWRSCRADDLQNPKVLAEAVSDLKGGAEEPLEQLLHLLTTCREKTATSLDRIVLQHSSATQYIDDLIGYVLDEEDARFKWRDHEMEPDYVRA